MSFEVMSKRCYDTAMTPRWCRHRPVTAALEFISWPYTGSPKNLRLSLMVIYVHQQKQRNHLGWLLQRVPALILHLRLEKFMNSLADSNNIPYYKGKRKLCKLYTNPTFDPTSIWFPARYDVYSLRCKPYTNHTLNYTLRRFKPYTKTIHESLHRHTNPTQKLYTKAYTATLHCNGTQFYLGAHPGKTRSAPKKN